MKKISLSVDLGWVTGPVPGQMSPGPNMISRVYLWCNKGFVIRQFLNKIWITGFDVTDVPRM